MAKTWILDKIMDVDVEYETPARTAYKIKRIGTNSSSAAKLVIDGKELGAIVDTVAPLHKTSSNLLGPLDLRDEYYIVPPKTKFKFIGASGSKMRVIGEILNIGVGEALPGPWSSRFDRQGDVYRRYFTASLSVGTDVAWGANEEKEVLSLTPLTTEKVTFDDIVMVSISGGTVSEGDFGVEFYLDNSPLEVDVPSAWRRGIDALSMPAPPSDSTEEEVFTLKDMPIVVEGDHTLSIRVRNVSGASKSPDSGSSWTVVVYLVGKYERLR